MTTKKKTQKRMTSKPQLSAAGDVLARVQAWANRPREQHQPLTIAGACALVERIVGLDDDEITHALLRLLEGMAYAPTEAGAGHVTAEDIYLFAGAHAYAHTIHGHMAQEEFMRLDPSDPAGARVLRREFGAE